jgi:hypothetical protein
LIDLKQNRYDSRPIGEVLDKNYPVLRLIAQQFKDNFLSPIRSTLLTDGTENLVVTMDELLRRTPFADRMRRMLGSLAEHYQSPVDLEFTVQVLDPNASTPDVRISILQCRPQSYLQETVIQIPKEIPKKDLIFRTNIALPHGEVGGIRYVVFVAPEGYYRLPSAADRIELGRAIGRLNSLLADERFICLGPGRWGTTTPDLGVQVGYSEIYNTKALIELSGEGVGAAPEPSFGTHFFQDLLEANIFPLAIYLGQKDVVFKRDFFYNTPNRLLEYLPEEQKLTEALRVIRVDEFRAVTRLCLIINGEISEAVAILEKENQA